jgi:hypothetical protein
VAVAVGYAAVSMLQLSIYVDSLAQVPRMLINLFGAFFYRFGRRRRQGKVYDTKTGKPVPLARVTIYDEEGNPKETKTTDKYGTYFFLVPKGDYTIEASKKGYEIATEEESKKAKTVYANAYTKGKTITANKDDIISQSIPVKQTKISGLARYFGSKSIYNVISIIFWVGLIFSVLQNIFNPTVSNYIITAIYVMFYILRVANLPKPKWGVVSKSKKPVPFTIIEAIDSKEKELVARSVSDEKGRYAFILNPGYYKLTAKTSQGAVSETRFKLDKRKIMGKDITLDQKD